MRIMFEAVIVTNETSYVPTGHGNGDEIGEGDVAGNDVAGNDDGEIGHGRTGRSISVFFLLSLSWLCETFSLHP